jgi:inosine/xanthosine triphosphate pyrophosphatase family protein
MSAGRKMKIVYVTSNQYKRDENAIFVKTQKLANGALVNDMFEFEIRTVRVQEILHVDIEAMVREEVKSAYRQVRVPCIVEHTGLIFADYANESYPGGLTKPMWDVLGDRFLLETGSAGRRALARAVVAYTDGMTVKTFVGERCGVLAGSPRGSRAFYWDTVFVPDDPGGKGEGNTYAEIVDDPALGLEYKLRLSQSTAAMLNFLEYRQSHPPPLWLDGI